jgi:hypothetical protein
MLYALVQNQNVLKYPYSFEDLRIDNPDVSFPVDPPEALLAEWGVVVVQPTVPAPFDRLTETVEPATPEFVDGELQERWTIRSATAEELELFFTSAADYRGFYDALILSDVYQAIRAKAATSLPLTVSCTEFMAAFADAKARVPNRAVIQACFNNILAEADLSEEQINNIAALMQTHNLDLLYTLEVTQ